VILWSGGIDSTAALVALLNMATPDEQRNVLEIHCAPRAVQEYPKFFEDVVRSGPCRLRWLLAPQLVTSVPEADTSRLPMVVTGEGGDQIFGSALFASAFHQTDAQSRATELPGLRGGLDAPWQDSFLAYMFHKLAPEPNWEAREGLTAFAGGHERHGPFAEVLTQVDRWKLSYADAVTSWESFLHPQLSQCPFPIVSNFDLLWWLNFSMKYQHVQLRMSTVQPNRTEFSHFFMTEPFQLWSLTNHDQKMPDHSVLATYKWPLKEFICDFTGDDAYLQHKQKVGSLQQSESHVAAIYSDFSTMSVSSLSKHVAGGHSEICIKDGVSWMSMVQPVHAPSLAAAASSDTGLYDDLLDPQVSAQLQKDAAAAAPSSASSSSLGTAADGGCGDNQGCEAGATGPPAGSVLKWLRSLGLKPEGALDAEAVATLRKALEVAGEETPEFHLNYTTTTTSSATGAEVETAAAYIEREKYEEDLEKALEKEEREEAIRLDMQEAIRNEMNRQDELKSEGGTTTVSSADWEFEYDVDSG
jgi:hypothetical protein